MCSSDLAICSAIVIVLMTIFLTHIFITNDRLVLQETVEDKAATALKVIANATGARIREAADLLPGRGNDSDRMADVVSRLNRDLSQLRQGMAILEVNVRTTSGAPIASSRVGAPLYEADRHALQAAIDSRRHTFSLSWRASADSGATPADRRIGHVYLPILDTQRNPIAVLDAVVDATVDARLTAYHNIGVALVVLAAFAVIYCALLMMVRRADSIVRRQYLELAAMNATLEQRVSERAGAAERAADRARRYNAMLVEEIAERRQIEDVFDRRELDSLARSKGIDPDDLAEVLAKYKIGRAHV